jgi:hypothetical protein
MRRGKLLSALLRLDTESAAPYPLLAGVTWQRLVGTRGRGEDETITV